MTERTFFLIKPDGVERALTGTILARIEAKGLKIVAMDMRQVSRETAAEHYAEHSERPFYGDLLEFITSGPVVAGVLEGPRAIAAWRQLAGGTDPVEKAAPGSIRGDFGHEPHYNHVPGTPAAETAASELALCFPGL
ncbi:nucleoside-diphosphate kinase [Dietzia maris]|uniref:nucleoside-diphosphate kinase n=1 Tax=Dietzia maris TaxID=37915 RepID=UPI003443F9CC